MPPHIKASRHHQARQALLRLALVVFPVTALTAPAARTVHRFLGTPVSPSQPYLDVVGPPPLRLAEVVVPIEPDYPVAPGAPPQPGAAPPPPPPEPDTSEATPIALAIETDKDGKPVTEPAAAAKSASPPPDEKAEPAANAPEPILPDEYRKRVRIEDFLPYFQPPGQTFQPAEPARPPGPAPLPPSSATYKLQ